MSPKWFERATAVCCVNLDEQSFVYGLLHGEEPDTVEVEVYNYDSPNPDWQELSQGDIIQLDKSRWELHPVDTLLVDVNENSLLKNSNPYCVILNLRNRYYLANTGLHLNSTRKIYSYVGWTLLALNPYKQLDDLYSANCLARVEECVPFSKLPPHPFSLAKECLSRLHRFKESQTIVVSGESGSGKTETAKHILQYLVFASKRSSAAIPEEDKALSLDDQLIRAQPLIEVFGNAKTIRNDNSSRFGRALDLKFDTTNCGPGGIIGASLSTYLLAKNRIVKVPSMEQNYHIFYTLLFGADDQCRSKLGFPPKPVNITESWCDSIVNQFDYLKQLEGPPTPVRQNCPPSAGRTDPPWQRYLDSGPFSYNKIVSAMEALGIDHRTVFSCLALILHIGNIEFQAKDSSNSCSIASASAVPLDYCSKLLGSSVDRLSELFTTKQIRETRSELSTVKAKEQCDSLAKALYEGVFRYVMSSMGEVLMVPNDVTVSGMVTPITTRPNATSSSQNNSKPLIGCIRILDIFGFEDLSPVSTNGFEQLCINYANEQLHQLFLAEVINKELTLYQAEGISLASGDLENFAHVPGPAISLIKGLPGKFLGIFPLLDECSRVGKVAGSNPDHALLSRLDGSQTGLKKRNTRDGFVINHFVAPVDYTIGGFVQTNADSLSQDIKSFLLQECPLLGGIVVAMQETQPFSVTASSQSQGTSNYSTSKRFAKQLDQLLKEISKTRASFIRCIKPNHQQKPNHFDILTVLNQLRTGGLLDSLLVTKYGYPCRLETKCLTDKISSSSIPDQIKSKMSSRELLTLLIEGYYADKAEKPRCAVGLTQTFFSFGSLEMIEDLLLHRGGEKLSQYVMSAWFRYKWRSATVAIKIGCNLARHINRIRFRNISTELAHQVQARNYAMQAAAINIQKVWRGFKTRKKVATVRHGIKIIQRAWKLYLKRKIAELETQESPVILLPNSNSVTTMEQGEEMTAKFGADSRRLTVTWLASPEDSTRPKHKRTTSGTIFGSTSPLLKAQRMSPIPPPEDESSLAMAQPQWPVLLKRHIQSPRSEMSQDETDPQTIPTPLVKKKSVTAACAAAATATAPVVPSTVTQRTLSARESKSPRHFVNLLRPQLGDSGVVVVPSSSSTLTLPHHKSPERGSRPLVIVDQQAYSDQLKAMALRIVRKKMQFT